MKVLKLGWDECKAWKTYMRLHLGDYYMGAHRLTCFESQTSATSKS
jgi:hypothetical protein